MFCGCDVWESLQHSPSSPSDCNSGKPVGTHGSGGRIGMPVDRSSNSFSSVTNVLGQNYKAVSESILKRSQLCNQKPSLKLSLCLLSFFWSGYYSGHQTDKCQGVVAFPAGCLLVCLEQQAHPVLSSDQWTKEILWVPLLRECQMSQQENKELALPFGG